MKVFIGGIVLTAAVGFVGCGKKSSDSEPESKPNEGQPTSVSNTDTKSNVEKVKALIAEAKTDAPANVELLAQIEARILAAVAAAKPATGVDAEAMTEIRASLAKIGEGPGSEKVGEILTRLDNLEIALNAKQTPFHRACIASLNDADADSDLKRNVVNAIAFINTSKIARATEVTQADFDFGSALKYGDSELAGVVFSGTKSEFRRVDSSYSYYAYSRLPSPLMYDRLNFSQFTMNGNVLNGLESTRIDRFISNDRAFNYETASLFDIISVQDPVRAINANAIESYTRNDCDRVATYMSNVGSKALTNAIDDSEYRTRFAGEGKADTYTAKLGAKVGAVVSDIFAMLNFREQDSAVENTKRKFGGYSDSPRVMVIQDDLLRRKVSGAIDYSFLDLVDAPHLRFLAALDSEVGQAKVQEGVDFDNAYEGKNTSLINFVTRHRKDVDHSRSEKGYRDLEAVFVRFVPEVVETVPEVKKKSHNLFHTP